MQSCGYFSNEASFRLKFHCLLRNRILPLSKNRSPELIFLPQNWVGLASCLGTQHQRTPSSKFALFHVSSLFPVGLTELLSELGFPDTSRGLLPDEEVPSPAQRPKDSREHWGIVQSEPLGRLAAKKEVLILSCWASQAAALRLSILHSQPWQRDVLGQSLGGVGAGGAGRGGGGLSARTSRTALGKQVE